MTEETEQFERRLSELPLRRIPAEWRQEILVAADVNRRSNREFTFAATIMLWLRRILWPSPVAWAGLAAIWILILAVDFSVDDKTPVIAEKTAPPSPAVIAQLQQQQRLLAELMGPRESSDADRSKLLAPRPRSERMEFQMV